MPDSTILVINPNSTESMTRGIDEACAPLRMSGGPGIECATLKEGPPGIETQQHVDGLIAPLVSFVRKSEARYAAFVIACYSDPGLHSVREATRKPVLGIAECGILTALTLGQRFGVIAILQKSIPRHLRYMGALGVTDRLAAELPVGLGIAEMADREKTFCRVAASGPTRARGAADRTTDVRRRPAEMLAFIGVREGMVALDVSAAGGYTTELIARAVGPKGRVYGQTRAPDPRQRLAERAKTVGNIVPVVRPFENPAPPELASNGFDLVTLMFNYHDFGHMGVDRAQLNRNAFAALKPGGLYLIADHSGRAGTGISESGTLHRIEEAFLRKEVEAAGFQPGGEGGFLRNPNDPRDRETPDPLQPKDEFD